MFPLCSRSSPLPLKYSKLTITKLQPLLMEYWPDLIIVTIFTQNLILLFQLCINGQNSIQHYGPLIWSIIPVYINDFDTYSKTKSENGIRSVAHLMSHLWKNYIPNLGFINQISFFVMAYYLVYITLFHITLNLSHTK